VHGSRLKVMHIFYGILARLASEGTENAGILTPAVSYLDNHFCDPLLSNQILADVAGISESYLRRLFLDTYKTSPKQYILEMRAQKAKQLLSETRDSVSDIAPACGFASIHHFCRTFKEITGLTPTAYRNQFPGRGI